MRLKVGHYLLRKPEPKDAEQLVRFRNDREVSRWLGGFAPGYSTQDFVDWIESHRLKADEVLWVIADRNDSCVGHVGLYEIDYRAGVCEFAICIGKKALWGKGLGQTVTSAVLDFAFEQLNMHRVEIEALSDNKQALTLYERHGFVLEGCRREAQYKEGRYHDIVIMAIMRSERDAARKG